MSKATELAQEEAQMDMTPMIDVVFLLIIFFLCIDFRVLEAKLPAYLPKDKGAHKTEVEPQEQLSLQIVCDNWGDEVQRNPAAKPTEQKGRVVKPSHMLVGHEVHYMLGPKRIRTVDDLVEDLRKIAGDKSKLQRDPKTGEMKLMAVVIEPGVSTTYGDVATVVDAVNKAGFTEVNFGGGLGARKPGQK